MALRGFLESLGHEAGSVLPKPRGLTAMGPGRRVWSRAGPLLTPCSVVGTFFILKLPRVLTCEDLRCCGE